MAALSDKDIRRELGKNIIIEEFSDKSLSPVGYDIRIGAAFLPGIHQTARYSEGEELIIKPNSMLQIICKEFIWISPKILATIHSRGSFAVKGLILNSTTIDPNWNGQMALTLYNVSDNDIVLKVGDRFATVIFYYCKTPTLERPGSRAIEGITTVAFSEYEHSALISQSKSKFDMQMQKVKTSPEFLIRNISFSLFTKVNVPMLIKLSLILSTVLLVALPVGLYDVLTGYFGWTEEYTLSTFFANLAICVSLMVALKKNEE